MSSLLPHEELEMLLQYTEQPFLLLDANLHVLSFNKKYEDLNSQYLSQQIERGVFFMDYTQEAAKPRLASLFERVLAGNEETVEWTLQPLTGNPQIFTAKYKPYKNNKGNVVGIFVTIFDITEIRLAQQKLSDNEKRFRALVENSADGLILFDSERKPLYVAPSFHKILGYTEEELAKIDPYQIIRAEDLPAIQQVWKEVIDNPGKAVNGGRVQMLHKNGEWRWLESTITNLLQDDAVRGIVDNFRDITGYVLAEEALKKSEEKYRNLFRDNPSPTWICDTETKKFLEVNNEAVITYGYSREEFLNMRIQDIRPESDVPLLNAISRKDLQGSSIYKGVWRHTKKNGKVIDVEITSHLIEYQGRKASLVQAIDITDKLESKRQSEFERKSKEALINSTNELIWSIDTNFILMAANRAFIARMYQSTGTILRPGQMILDPDKYTDRVIGMWKGLYERAFAGESFKHEIYVPQRNEVPESWVEVNFTPIFDNLQLTGIACFGRYTTERKKAEQTIKATNERYNLVAKATNDSIWDWDMLTGKVERMGDGFETLFGYKIEEAAEDNFFWTKLCHPDDLPRVKASHAKVFADPAESFWADEYRVLKSNGEYAYVYDKGFIIRDENGKAIRMIGSTQDITQRRSQVNEMTRIKNNLNSLINTTTDLVWSVDRNLKLIAANKAFSDVTYGLTGRLSKEGDEVIGSAWPVELAEKWKAMYARGLRGETFSSDETYYLPDNSVSYAIVSLAPIHSRNGEITGVACFSKDVTAIRSYGEQLKQLNAELKKRADELTVSNNDLERFAYIASHDLQEPLRMVSSFLQLLEKKYKGQIDEASSRYIHFAVDGADRMKKLIQDLLAYSRVGTTNDTVSDTDMNEVMEEVKSNLKNNLEELNATFSCDSLPVLTGTRKTQMLQLMQNLVGNALKYHSEKNPEVKVAVVEREDEWLFSVKDNGIGIDPRYADKIFIIFQRLHSKAEYSGTGIGLSICKKIVERHGGKIWVESEPGAGSIFYFNIKKQPPTDH